MSLPMSVPVRACAFVWILLAPMAAAATPVQLNFAAVNQNPWGSGAAVIIDRTYRLPDPHLTANVNLGEIETDPMALLADLLGFDADLGLSVHPSASFSAGLTASYHINGGALSVNFPQQVELMLPDSIPAGRFTVSARYPDDDPVPPAWGRQFGIGAVTTVAGAGYGQFFNHPVMINPLELTPVAGFSTTFPFAEARLGIDVAAHASINVEACAIVCVDVADVNVPSIDYHQQLLEISTLTGIEVLDRPVVQLGEPYDVSGWGTLTIHSPSLNLASEDGPAGTLVADGSTPVVDFGFNLEQLIPFVGQVLHREFAGFGYELLSLQPHATLGLYQNLSFTPSLKVQLEFSEPVIHNGTATNAVRFGIGETVEIAPTGNALGGTMTIKPTFLLENTFHNETGILLSGSVDVSALKLETPVDVGPAFRTTLDLFTLALPPLFDESFAVNIPPITTPAVTLVKEIGDIGDLRMHQSSPPDEDGLALWDIDPGGLGYTESAYGRVVDVPLIPRAGAVNLHQQMVVFQDDVIIENEFSPFFGMNLGTMLCLTCQSYTDYFAPDSPHLTDLLGTLFLSNLAEFPALMTAAEVLATDPVLAQSNYYRSAEVTEGRLVASAPVPEPSTWLLLATGGAMGYARVRRRAGWRRW